MVITNGADHLTQWDTGQTLTFSASDGVSVADAFHFARPGMAAALVLYGTKQGTDVLVQVPNLLLVSSGPFIVYQYVVGNDSARTKKSWRVEVAGRPKPASYVYTPTEVATWEQLAADITQLEAGKLDAPSGGTAGQVLTKTAEGASWQTPSGGGSSYDDTELRGLIAGKYAKPAGGIPAADLTSAVQASLGKADKAMAQPSNSGTAGQVLTRVASGYSWQTPQTLTNLGNVYTEELEAITSQLTELPSYTAFITGFSGTYYEPDEVGTPQQAQAEELPQLITYDYLEDADGNTYDGVRLLASGHFYYLDPDSGIVIRRPTEYVPLAQGATNSGKFLAVSQAGQVELVDAPGGGESWELLRDVTLTEAVRKIDTGVKVNDYRKLLLAVNTVQNTSVTTCHLQYTFDGLSASKFILESSGLHNTQRRIHHLMIDAVAGSIFKASTSFSSAVTVTTLSNPIGGILQTVKEYGVIEIPVNGTLGIMPYTFADASILLAANTRYAIWGVK